MSLEKEDIGYVGSYWLFGAGVYLGILPFVGTIVEWMV